MPTKRSGVHQNGGTRRAAPICGLVERLTAVRKRGTLCRRRGSLSHEEGDRVKRLVQFLFFCFVGSFVLFPVVGAFGCGSKSAVYDPPFRRSPLFGPWRAPPV